ncbi:hypothetical protein B0H13DRAFT_2572423 [Mycena leptocephala]|nr:hypothetical protein B0H13DRAFT_2572423 [Mycena leptocephala]
MIISFQCSILNMTLPGKVFFPDSEEYQAQGASYYALAQSELKPTCRVSATSADDVSVIVWRSYDKRGSIQYRALGFTIDLQKIDTISLSRDQKTVSIGPGASWKMVYHALEPYNLTAAGGRTSNVGVAGFLLGGGVSFLSLEHGFGSDNVVAYEVVLADGSIRVATPHSHRDLYWALKYGSTNFGIVTRFDMSTFPVDQIWGGAFFYNISHARPLLDSLVNFTAALADDPKAFGFISGFTAQPINVGLVAAGSKNGGNPIGLSTDDGDLILVLIPLYWSDPADDAILIPKFQELCEWAENEARRRGLLHRFVYMNYALGTQRVMESGSARPGDLERVFTVTVALCQLFLLLLLRKPMGRRQRTFARRHATSPTAPRTSVPIFLLRLSTEADENLKNGAITPPHTYSASLARAGVENCPTTSSSPSFKNGAISSGKPDAQGSQARRARADAQCAACEMAQLPGQPQYDKGGAVLEPEWTEWAEDCTGTASEAGEEARGKGVAKG